MNLETPRLYIADLPLHVIQKRNEVDDFHALVSIITDSATVAASNSTASSVAGPIQVHFPPAWPGDPLVLFPDWAAHFDPAAVQRGGMLIRKADLSAIGLIGDKGDPSPEGALDIGYGLNPEAWNQGYATEALLALLPHWLALPGVRSVTADTARANPASGRVLEKCGLRRVGEGWSEEDGDLILWALDSL